MTDQSAELATAWDTNCAINRVILDAVSDGGLHCTLSTRGGRGVSGEFAHMHNIRLAHLEKRAKDLASGVVKLDASSKPSRATLRKAFKQSDAAIRSLLIGVLNEEAKRRGFKRGIYTTLSYFIAHEAHHRGRILLTLKVSKHTLDKDTQMKIWAWDQI
ncbi:MAG: DinB family protein [Phycisphaera sp.]|nr:MAG: DinB family protein [Phycisphaera sp.]